MVLIDCTWWRKIPLSAPFKTAETLPRQAPACGTETAGFPANNFVDGSIVSARVFRNEETFQYADAIS